MLKKFVDLLRCFILGCLGCVEQIRGSIRMCYFGLFGLSSSNSWIYSDALYLVVWVVFSKLLDLFECAILGCLGCLCCVEQIRGCIRMGYFGLFGFS